MFKVEKGFVKITAREGVEEQAMCLIKIKDIVSCDMLDSKCISVYTVNSCHFMTECGSGISLDKIDFDIAKNFFFKTILEG